MKDLVLKLFILSSAVGVIGIVITEVLLIYAMISKKPRFDTRTVGRWILAFLAILTVSVAAVIFLMRS